jgi:hypothetical protein
MGFVNRFLALTFVCLVLVSLFVVSVKSNEAYATSTPSVPEFTVKLVDNSYDVPPTQTTDQYTGVTTTQPGYRVDNRSIEVSIKNQPFTSYNDTNGYKISLCYKVEVKGHFGDDSDWRDFKHSGHTIQSDSVYTIVSNVVDYDAGVQLDFRVKAVIGYVFNYFADRPMVPPYWYVAANAESDWNSQTFTIPGVSSTSPTSPAITFPATTPGTSDNNQPQRPNQTQPPNFAFNPFFLLGVIALLVCVIIILALLFIVKQTKTSTHNDNNSPQTDDSSRALQNAIRGYAKCSILRLRCLWV